jgi:hypothetical protein
MKRSLSHGAGFLEIDHRESPGLTLADVAHAPGAIAVGAGQHLERDIMQCSHCQRGVVLNPGRVRARAVCPKCHHFLCDSCEAVRVKTGECVPFKAVLDRAHDIAATFARQPDHPAAAFDPLALIPAPTVTVPDGPRIVVTDTQKE